MPTYLSPGALLVIKVNAASHALLTPSHEYYLLILVPTSSLYIGSTEIAFGTSCTRLSVTARKRDGRMFNRTEHIFRPPHACACIDSLLRSRLPSSYAAIIHVRASSASKCWRCNRRAVCPRGVPPYRSVVCNSESQHPQRNSSLAQQELFITSVSYHGNDRAITWPRPSR